MRESTAMVDFALGHRSKNKLKTEEETDLEIGANFVNSLTVKLPNSQVLSVVSRSLFLAVVILTLPSLGSIIGDSSDALQDYAITESDSSDFKGLPFAFRDLSGAGLLSKGQQGLIVASSGNGDSPQDLLFLNDNDLDLVVESDAEIQDTISDETFDFVLAASLRCYRFADRVVKMGGIVVVQLSNDPSDEFRVQSNYRILYVQRFDSTVIAMRKVGFTGNSASPPGRRRLTGVIPDKDKKKVALEGLEDVMLEPPRKALAKTSNGCRKFKFLPDLLGDPLKSYPRRMFITDAESGVLNWFRENYPTRNQEFESYNVESDTGKELRNEAAVATGVSDWLLKNTREEDYVVVKAEAQAVEEMMEKGTISMVDELFLECKNQWQQGGGGKVKRAYWQCLALYGRLRDEGVAVHQWWG